MKRVLISVEGQTEETFVRQVLTPYFHNKQIDIRPTLVVTKKIKDGPNFKGGITTYEKVRNDILRLFSGNPDLVTTFYDFYGLPDNFPGKSSLPSGDCYTRVKFIEDAFAQNINNHRFLPYLQLHEFEAFAFIDIEITAKQFTNPTTPKGAMLSSLKAITNQFQSPEEINENPQNCPSRRIKSLYSAYDKVNDGASITKNLTIDAIRSTCAHFNEWCLALETRLT